MASFCLIHAAWHGSWCWRELSPRLEARGHRVIAPDLPCEEPDAGCSDYAAVVLDALADENDVVVLAHSLGGLTAPLVAAKRPVRRLIFLCALLPLAGRSWLEQLEQDPEMIAPGIGRGLAVDGRGRSFWPDEEVAIGAMYQDCRPEIASWAAAQLRPQGQAPYREPCPLTAWPEVKSTYLLARDDRVVPAAWARQAPVERVRANVAEFPGGHSPFLSRPERLALLLDQLV